MNNGISYPYYAMAEKKFLFFHVFFLVSFFVAVVAVGVDVYELVCHKCRDADLLERTGNWACYRVPVRLI